MIIIMMMIIIIITTIMIIILSVCTLWLIKAGRHDSILEPMSTDDEVLIRRPKTDLIIKTKQDRQCMHNVTLLRGRAAIVAVEKQ
jgi:hypothetical protein